MKVMGNGNGRKLLTICDDPVTEPLTGADLAKATEWLREHYPLPVYTKGGAYRNKFGELVTWDATEDGSCVNVQTWPGELEPAEV